MRNDQSPVWPRHLLRLLVCLLFGLLAGFLAMLLAAWLRLQGSGGDVSAVLLSALEGGFLPLLRGGVAGGFMEALDLSAPIILTGLSAALCGQAGLWQLGAAGAYALGGAAAVLSEAFLKLPWFACLMTGTLAGAVWGLIPGWLKVRFQTPEALTTALLSWAGVYGARAILQEMGEMNAAFPRPTVWPFLLALGAAVLLWLYLRLTVGGYELRLMGQSEKLARYAGVDLKKHTLALLTVSGALAGLAGALGVMLTQSVSLPPLRDALSGPGVRGFAAAFLSGFHPAGTAVTALLVSHLSLGSQSLDGAVFPPETGNLILFVILLFASVLLNKSRGKGEKQ